MDPVSVVSLVASVGSLATKCTSIVKTLHSLAETYKSAELSILSIIEECETIRLAWKRIEEWAKQSLHHLDGYEDVGERLQRSIYSGDLIMSALEIDLAKAASKSGTFRRRASVAWNTSTFHEHQGRIRGQVAALQLLLQVISMPQAKDRDEVFSLKEHVFKEVDESVLSIIPSHLSSRFSMADTDRSSVRSKSSIALRYIPLSFENDLFSSYVYKRNYRLPFRTKKLPTSGYVASVRSTTTERVIERTDSDLIIKLSELSFATVREEEVPSLNTWDPTLYLEEGIDILRSDHPSHSLDKTLVEYVCAGRSHKALNCLQEGADVCSLLSHEQAAVGSHLFQFFADAYREDADFTVTLLERIALSAGTAWMTRLRTFSTSSCWDPSSGPGSVKTWNSVRNAAAWFDEARLLVGQTTNRPTVLQLACASSNFDVASYLLQIGFRPVAGKEYSHPLILAESRDMTFAIRSLLITKLGIPTNLLDRALWSLLADDLPENVYWNDGKQSLMSFEKAFQTFLENGANPNAKVECYGMRMPLIHGLIYAIHEHEALQPLGTKLIGILINNGLDVNVIATWGRQKIKLSPMHLAARLGEYELAATLLFGGGNRRATSPFGHMISDTMRSQVEGIAARSLTNPAVSQTFKIARDGIDRLMLAIALVLVFVDNEYCYSFTPKSYSMELDALSAYFQDAGRTDEGSVADSDSRSKEPENYSYVTRRADHKVYCFDLEGCMSILEEPRDPNLRLSNPGDSTKDSIWSVPYANSSEISLLVYRVTSMTMDYVVNIGHKLFAARWTMGCLLWRRVCLALTGIDLFRPKMYAMERCYSAFEFAIVSDKCEAVESMVESMAPYSPFATHQAYSHIVTLAALNHSYPMFLVLQTHAPATFPADDNVSTMEVDYLALSILSKYTHWAMGALYRSHWELKPEAVLQIFYALLIRYCSSMPRQDPHDLSTHQFERDDNRFPFLRPEVEAVLTTLPQNATEHIQEHVGEEIGAVELAYYALSRDLVTIESLVSKEVKVVWPEL